MNDTRRDRAPPPQQSVLTRLQRGLEALYRVETQLAVEHFLIGEEQRTEAGPARAPRELNQQHQNKNNNQNHNTNTDVSVNKTRKQKTDNKFRSWRADI